MEKGLKECSRSFPSNAEPSVVLQPGDRALDGLSSLAATQRSTILSLVLGESIRSMRRDEFDAALGEDLVERIAIVGIVADDTVGQRFRNHEVEELLCEMTFGAIRESRVDRRREAVSIEQDHDLHAFADSRESDAIASAFRLGEGGVDEALVEPVAIALFDETSRGAEDLLEDALFHPSLDPAMHGAPAARTSWKVLPFRTVVEHSEDAGDDLALVDAGSPAERAFRQTGNLLTDPVEYFA